MTATRSKVTLPRVKKTLLTKLRDHLDEVEAMGIFGSLARGTFGERSDIDVFLVLPDDPVEVQEMWWHRVSDALEDFQRDVTVLVYTFEGLKAVSNWYVLRLASEGVLIYDPGNRVKQLFKKIIKAAHKAGLVERDVGGGQKVWTTRRPLERGEIIEVRVED